jgi:opacity protein-like surface antigen
MRFLMMALIATAFMASGAKASPTSPLTHGQCMELKAWANASAKLALTYQSMKHDSLEKKEGADSGEIKQKYQKLQDRFDTAMRSEIQLTANFTSVYDTLCKPAAAQGAVQKVQICDQSGGNCVAISKVPGVEGNYLRVDPIR